MVSEKESKFVEERPQRLCLMCGKCCRVVTTPTPYEELKKMAEEGDTAAQDFLGIFEPFESTDDARKISAEIVDNILARIDNTKEQTTFYTCKHLKNDNLCSIYAERPKLCKHFPSKPWAIVPPNCGYEGWLFLKQEEHKQTIRKLKEELLDLEIQLKYSKSNTKSKKIQRVIDKINDNIKLYGEFGPTNF